MTGFVQQGAVTAATNGVCSPSITGVTGGNTLICWYQVNDAISLTAPSDSAAQSWTIQVQTSGNGVACAIAYLLNANAGTHTLTWTTTPDAAASAISEWSGITGVGGTPQATNLNTITTITTPSYTPGSSSEVVIACAMEFGAATNDSFHCTTAGFQSIGSSSDSGSNPCWMIEQNGSSFNAGEANAQIISSASPLTATWAWTPGLPGACAIAGFTYSGTVVPGIAWIT
jgi:hypothetical protein